MGTFLGHIIPGFALTLLGLWHTINTIRAYYLKGSTNYKSKFWYSFKCFLPQFKHLELVLILSFSIFSIIMQLLDFPFVRFTSNLVNFEHAAMFLHLAIYAGFALSSELTQSSEILSGVAEILAASVFGQQLFLLHFHSTDHVGLEGHYHWLLQLIVFVSLVAAVAATSFPTSFNAALVLSISIVFQGCWFMDMGFMLWVAELVPRGCFLQFPEASNDQHGAVTCGSQEADLRARALANLQFSCILAGIMIFTGCICLKLAGKDTTSLRSTEYEYLHSRNADVPIDIDNFKQARIEAIVS